MLCLYIRLLLSTKLRLPRADKIQSECIVNAGNGISEFPIKSFKAGDWGRKVGSVESFTTLVSSKLKVCPRAHPDTLNLPTHMDK